MTFHTSPTASVIVSTSDRDDHLARCLLSLSSQRLGVGQSIEVIVAKDGDDNATAEMIRHMLAVLPFPCSLVSQPNHGFRKSRIVNQAIRKAQSDYLLFTDGDCIFRPDFLQRQLSFRHHQVTWVSDCIRLDQRVSESITSDKLADASWLKLVQEKLPRSLRYRFIKDRIYQTLGHSRKPKLIGNNFGVWHSDLLAINGFDESFQGWGCEDDDLGLRLRASGVRIKTNLSQTFGYHLWHPLDPSAPKHWDEGTNTDYFQRELVLPSCLNGLCKRDIRSLNYRISAPLKHRAIADRIRASHSTKSPSNIDIDILIGDCQVKKNTDAKNVIQILFPNEPKTRTAMRSDVTWTVPESIVCAGVSLQRESVSNRPVTELVAGRVADWFCSELHQAILGKPRTLTAQTIRLAA